MITDQIRRVFERVPCIRFYFSPYFFIFYPARDTFFCNFPFIFYISRHTFVSKLGTMNLLMVKLSSGETTVGCKCWHRNPFFSSGSQTDSHFLNLTTRKCWHKKPLFEWKPSTNSICKQIQSEYLLST